MRAVRRAAPGCSRRGWVGCGSGFAVHGATLAQRYGGQPERDAGRASPACASIAGLAARMLERGGGLWPAEQAAPVYMRDKVALTVNERRALKAARGELAEQLMSAVLSTAPVIRPMRAADLDAVMAIEQAIYSHPWTRGNFHDSLHGRLQLLGDGVRRPARGLRRADDRRARSAPAQSERGRRLAAARAWAGVCCIISSHRARQRSAAHASSKCGRRTRRRAGCMRDIGFRELYVRRGYYPAGAGARGCHPDGPGPVTERSARIDPARSSDCCSALGAPSDRADAGRYAEPRPRAAHRCAAATRPRDARRLR